MKQILIRAGKSPFAPHDPYETFDRNLIAGNNGNLIFAAATHKLLSAEGVKVEAHGYHFDAKQAPQVNEKYDAFVLPLANAFRPAFESSLKSLTQFIDALKIPTVMLSGGAQSGPDGTYDHLKPMTETVEAFCKAVLRTSSHITVRGERTADYIRSLGFNDVIAIGCPSLTMHGPEHEVRAIRSKPRMRVAYNAEPGVTELAELVQNIETSSDATYFPQDRASFELLLWGVDKFSDSIDRRLPFRTSHHQFQRGTAEFHVDASTWIKRMKRMDLSFGPRIHGNIVPILAGTPAVVFAHDSRTLELSQYHDIPHVKANEFGKIATVEDLTEIADYGLFNQGQAARVAKVQDFLHGNGMSTIFDSGQEAARQDYEERLGTVDFPEPQTADWSGLTPNEAARVRRQRVREVELSKSIATLRKQVSDLQGALKTKS